MDRFPVLRYSGNENAGGGVVEGVPGLPRVKSCGPEKIPPWWWTVESLSRPGIPRLPSGNNTP